jgi:hypothetical protein
MSRRAAAALAVGAILCVAGVRAGTRPPASQTRVHAGPPIPIVVELFTSEGCSNCPPADTLLAKLADATPVEGAEVVALGHHVDYWDELGWKDRFSSAALTDRQRVYSRALNVESIYTPQLVVDGRAELVGSDAGAARRALERALDVPHGRVTLDIEPAGANALSIAVSASELPPPGRGDRDDIVVAVTEDRLKTDVRRGENHGRVLSHAAVVRSLTTIGQASPESVVTWRLPLAADWNRGNLKIIAFVQESRSRHIVAARSRPVPSATR